MAASAAAICEVEVAVKKKFGDAQACRLGGIFAIFAFATPSSLLKMVVGF